MRLRIASWNINSVRPRTEMVARFVKEQAPDVLMLQEIKCQEDQFPREAFQAMGLPHVKIAGQKGWHGVAIASALPLEDAPRLDVCREGHARCVSAKVAGIELQNLYIPAGGDLPDPEQNPKFAHKLDFFARLTAEISKRDPNAPLLIAGDLNVAPGEYDVWSHKQLLRIVSHTPVEMEAMAALQAAGRFIDPVREAFPEPQKLYSWWSYRSPDHTVTDKGRRLDHIWITPGLREPAFRQGCAARIHPDVRAWPNPSDHVPVSLDLIL